MGSKYNEQIELQKGVKLKTTVGNVHDTTPTAAQLTTEFAAASETTMAEVQVVNDAAGGTNVYLAVKLGTDYFWTKLTKAL